jgi:phage terminase large subunit-like protein
MLDAIPEQEAIFKRISEEREKRRRENQLVRYRPYDRQIAFHLSGATHRERLFMAGNQLGKTLAGGSEVAMHATGKYPACWAGRRFDHPTVGWVGGVTAEATRDGAERILLGRAGERGTGTIPKADLISTVSRQGVADSIAIAKVRHISGRVSTIIFKSYDQGREKWQGDTIDWLWLDEEPPEAIYFEGLTRTNAGDSPRGGIVFITFTPLLGMSNVVKRFMREKSVDRDVVTMTIEDVEHYSAEQKRAIIESYPEHEREARTKGIPQLGSGRIFPVAEDRITYQPFPFPKFWRKLVGLDFGWDHPTAAAWIAYDPDADCCYVYDCYRVRRETPVIHAAAIRARGARIPVAWPHDGLQHDKGSGEQLAELYRRQGVAMLPERAQFDDERGSGVEAGVIDMLERMQTSRLKVAPHLHDWWEEFRLYYRKDGKIVKEEDDLMSATRYAIMSLRFAKADEAHPSDRYRSSKPAANDSAWAA